MQRIANEVETLISQNPKAVERFIEQLKVFNKAWEKYWSAKDNELPILDQQPDKSIEDAYKYDHHFKCWIPKDTPTLPPDPTKWELDNNYPSYYAILAVIYDLEKSKVAPFRLCEGILGNFVFAWMQRLLTRAWGFDKDKLDTALKWVKADIKKCRKKTDRAKTGTMRILQKFFGTVKNINSTNYSRLYL